MIYKATRQAMGRDIVKLLEQHPNIGIEIAGMGEQEREALAMHIAAQIDVTWDRFHDEDGG